MIKNAFKKLISMGKLAAVFAGFATAIGMLYFITSSNDKIRSAEDDIRALQAVVFSSPQNKEVIDYLKSIDSNYGNLKDFTMRHCNREM